MRLKSVIKYNLSELKKSIMIYYLILAGIAILFFTFFAVLSTDIRGSNGSINGGDTTTIIFIFIVGLASYKSNFLFFTANGVTRKTQFYGFLISALAACAVMAAIDTAYTNILTEFANYRSLFYETYPGWIGEVSKPVMILINFIWSTVLYMSAILLGYLITTLYYRMNKTLKIVVSVGVPALIFVVLPVVSMNFPNAILVIWFNRLLTSLRGLGINPYVAVLTLLVSSAISAGLSFLLARRAVVKL